MPGTQSVRQQAPDLIVSLRWSLVHASSIALLISIGYGLRQRHWAVQAGLSLTIAILGVSAVAWLLGVSSVPGYASIRLPKATQTQPSRIIAALRSLAGEQQARLFYWPAVAQQTMKD